ILEITADKMEKQFDFSDYERGVYFLRITHGGKVSYKKVVIQ
ncbi:T9SS type A sorting domain-containing protein, partial [Lentimicrobium sp. S6]|nr:T9SS type A sorting domain-containing protein [Lentimicrobium sp. S6]